MAVDPALQDSLNRSLTASGAAAKVRRAGKAKPGSENALNLLDSIIDDTVVEAERERRRLEEDTQRAEEEARLQKEREAAAAREEAEQAILAEQQAQEDLKLNRSSVLLWTFIGGIILVEQVLIVWNVMHGVPLSEAAPKGSRGTAAVIASMFM